MKISGFLVAILVVGLVVTVLTAFYADGATKYGENYTNSTFTGLNQYATITNISSSITTKLNNPEQSTIFTDIAAFISAGYDVLRLTFASVGVFTTMTNSAMGNIPYLGSITVFLIAIVTVIFLFIVLSMLLNRDA